MKKMFDNFTLLRSLGWVRVSVINLKRSRVIGHSQRGRKKTRMKERGGSGRTSQLIYVIIEGQYMDEKEVKRLKERDQWNVIHSS